MDHPQEDISQHISTLPDMLFDVQQSLIHHYQPSAFKKKVKEIRSNIFPQQNMIYCCSCRMILSKTPYISFEKRNCCIPCFSNILTFPSHYEICNSIDSFLFDEKWSLEEELKLLNAIERLGYGNWNDIQVELGNKKTALQIEDHYQLFYANHAKSPYIFPISNRKLKPNVKSRNNKKLQQQSQQLSLTQKRTPSANSNSQKNNLKQRKIYNQPLSFGKLIGYQQRRDDFEIQYDNQLELLISEMEFTQFDNQNIKEMKMNLLEIFSERLSKRYQVKDFAINRRLLDLNELNHNEKKKKKEEKQLIALLKPFARFASQEQMDLLVSGLLKQNVLRKQILKIIDKGSLNNEKIASQKQSSRASSISTSLHEKNNRKLKTQKQKAQCWFLGKIEIQICKRYGIDFIAFIFIKETIRSINAIQGKVNPEEYFYSIFRLPKDAIHEIYQNIQKYLPRAKITESLSSK